MIGSRLKRARESIGLSLRELEARLHGLVTAQAIGKYERNEMMPGSPVLLKLADVLGCTPEYLLSEQEIELTGIDFRKAPHASTKEERKVTSTVLEHIERYLELEELMPPTEESWGLDSDAAFCISRIEEAEEAAEALRRHWCLGIDPISVMVDLLEEKGVKVIALDLPENVSGSKALVQRTGFEDVPVIVINQKHNGERQRFTLAHELAHLVLSFAGLSDKEQENAADRFAGAFLMAKEMMFKLLGRNRNSISIGELTELKKIFKVSIAALVVRCSQLGIVTKTVYGQLFGHIKKLGWNGPSSKEPIPIPPEIPKRMERICLRAIAEEAISRTRAAELLQISIRDLDNRLLGQAI